MSATHFSGLNVGGGSDVSKIVVGTVSVNPASLASGAEADTSVTISGVAVGDKIVMNPPAAGLTAGIEICGVWASASNTVKIRLRNNTGGAIDEPAGTWNYILFR